MLSSDQVTESVGFDVSQGHRLTIDKIEVSTGEELPLGEGYWELLVKENSTTPEETDGSEGI